MGRESIVALDLDGKPEIEFTEDVLKAGHAILYPDNLRNMPEAPTMAQLQAGLVLQSEDLQTGVVTSAVKQWRMILICLPYVISVIGAGFDNGVQGMVTGMPSFLIRFGEVSGESLVLPTLWVSLWTGILQVFIAIGSFLCIFLLERFGPRTSNIIASILVLPSIAVCATANTKGVYLIGKCIGGLTIGVFFTSSSNFISESAAGSLRAFATSLINVFQMLGIMFGLLTAFMLIPNIENEWMSWRLAYLIEFVCPAITLLGLLFVPTSPVYLVKRGKPLEALKVLRRLYGPSSDDELRARLAVIQHTVSVEAAQSAEFGSVALKDLFANPIDRKRTLLTMGIWTCFNMSGAVFVANGVYFLEVMGLNVVLAGKIVIGMFALPIVLIFCMGYIMSRYGRRGCMVYGNILHTAVMLVIGCLGFSSSHQAKVAVGILIQIANSTVQISTGTAAYALNAEISSLRLRALTQSVGIGSYYVLQAALSVAVPFMYQSPGWLLAKTALIFAGTSAVSVVWAYFYVGETLGRTPEDIDLLFVHNVPATKWSATDVSKLRVQDVRDALEANAEA